MTILFIAKIPPLKRPYLTIACFVYSEHVGINNLQGMFSANWRFIAAGSIISTIPIIIFFLAMQKYFISGENDGAIKG